MTWASLALPASAGVLIVLLAAASSGRATHGYFRSAKVIATADGYALVDPPARGKTKLPGDGIGDFIWGRRATTRGVFGPFAIFRGSQPNVMLFLDNGEQMSTEDAVRLARTAPKALRDYEFGEPLGVAALAAGELQFQFEQHERRFIWIGAALNVAFWQVLLAFVWSACWLVFALMNLFDPRRKRAARLAASVCPNCNYDIRLIDSPRCPECGDRLVVDPWTPAEAAPPSA
ncbi:MAG: hypothetical protein IT430_01100 [Phycisphaerales bacterium]|nr:hypothetical protein [Phycisphaerales bacterium]